jgi:hypothetical protein
MDILTKPIQSFSFEDVVLFCTNGPPEGVEIDYKQQYPKRGIEKFLTAFSNTRGGVIIVGVEEDRKTGRPVKWEGIDDNAKLIETIYQESCNVTPQPAFEVHKTTPAPTGKVFVLIRVFEGDKTPYYVQNDSNIWIRTGNISNPIDISSPEWTELLVGKKEKAERARSGLIQMARDVYDAALIQAERERQTLISRAKQKGDGSERNYYQKKLGSEVVMFTIMIQPFFPREALAQPQEIHEKIQEISYPRNGYREFPDLNQAAVPEGMMHFKHNYDGYIESQQIYSKGLVYIKLDVLRVNEQGKRIVYLSHIAGRLFTVLKGAMNFYQFFGHQGVIKINLSLEQLVDTYLSEIRSDGYLFFDDGHEGLLQNYSWDFDLETRELNDPAKFKQLLYRIMRKIYWDLGFKELAQQIFDNFLRQNKLT